MFKQTTKRNCFKCILLLNKNQKDIISSLYYRTKHHCMCIKTVTKVGRHTFAFKCKVHAVSIRIILLNQY